MAYMIIFVLDNPDLCQDILEAWSEVGLSGITILESSGLGRVMRAGARDDLPLMPSLSDLFKSRETHHRTLFSVVKNQEIIEKVVEATEKIVGNLNDDNTGLLFVLPVHRVYGERKIRT